MTQQPQLGAGAVIFYWVAVLCGVASFVIMVLAAKPIMLIPAAAAVPSARRLIDHYTN